VRLGHGRHRPDHRPVRVDILITRVGIPDHLLRAPTRSGSVTHEEGHRRDPLDREPTSSDSADSMIISLLSGVA
jgi:hypothetical protein